MLGYLTLQISLIGIALMASFWRVYPLAGITIGIMIAAAAAKLLLHWSMADLAVATMTVIASLALMGHIAGDRR
jgi:hypothetical protein